MEKSFIFNSVNGDRRMKAEDFREYFNSFIGNGIFPNPATGLQVVAYDGMKLIVKEGSAFLKGAFYKNTEDLIITLDAADGVLDRIDRLVLRLDTLDRSIKCKIKKGTYASTPIAPTIQRDSDGFELGIADIYVSKGVVSILQSKITDTRLNTELCGIVTQTVKTIDTSELYRQLQEAIQEKGIDMDTWIREAKEYFSNWLESTQTEFANEFNTWFDGIKNILDENMAGNLLNMINDNRGLIETTTTIANEAKEKSEQALQSGVNAKNGMQEAINSKITVPDVSDLDSWNTYIQRVKDIKEGRGNAVVGDVLSGKTFTNDSGQMLTGTMPILTPSPNNPSHFQATDMSITVAQQAQRSLFLKIPRNNYIGNIDWIFVPAATLLAENIKKGVNVLGLIGTLELGKKWASGTVDFPSNQNLVDGLYLYGYGKINRPRLIVSSLSFKPSLVVVIGPETATEAYKQGTGVMTQFTCYHGAGGDMDAYRVDNNLIGFFSNGFRYCMPLNSTIKNLKWYAFE